MSIRLDRSARRLIGFHPLGWYDFQQTLAQDKMSALFDLHKKYETVFSSLMGMTLLEANSLPVSCGITARNTSIFEPYRKQGIKTYRQFFDRHLGIVDQALDEFQVLFGSIG
jgi:hypothetical protein